MANGDPLRAQEIENGLSEKWYKYFLIYNDAMMNVEKQSGLQEPEVTVKHA